MSGKPTRRSQAPNKSSAITVKLKDYLRDKYPDLSSRVIKRALEQGACKVNGKIERFATRRLDLSVDKVSYSGIRPEAQGKLIIDPKRIVLEDEHLIIYNKEGGYPTLATEGKDKVHLHGELDNYLRQRDGKSAKLYPVHRLDKNTSGLIIFAKGDQAARKLSDLFADKEICKNYEAIVDGVISTKKAHLSTYMRLEKQGRGWQRWSSINESQAQKLYREYIERKRANQEDDNVDFESFLVRKKYKTAITDYELIKAYPKQRLSHLKLMPATGRTHQLRVQMKGIGHSILGDTFYSDHFESRVMPARHLLHAARLDFEHPFTGAPIKLKAALPEDMAELLL